MSNKIFEEQLICALTEKEIKEKEWENLDYQVLPESAAALDKRMQKHFRRTKVRHIAARMGRAAAIFVLILLGIAIFTLSVSKTARAAFERWSKSVLIDRIVYLFQGKPEEEYKLPSFEAGWLPEGVELVSEEINSFGNSHTWLYQNHDQSIIILFGADLVQEGALLEYVDLDGYMYETFLIDGMTIEDYFFGEREHNVCWFIDEGKTALSLECTLTREQLIEFIEHLHRIE